MVCKARQGERGHRLALKYAGNDTAVRRLRCGRRSGENARQPHLDSFLAHFANNLLAGQICNIKHIDGLFAEGRDMGRADIEREV